MTVTPCQNIAERFVGFNYDSDVSLFIDKNTTPEEFDKQWLEKFGEMPLTAQMEKHRGAHALCAAAKNNNVALIHHIYQKNKFTLDLGDKMGRTPLFYAVWTNVREATTALIELGADVNIPATTFSMPQGATNLWHAVHCLQDVTIAKLLLKYGAIAEPALDESGKLHLKKAQDALETERAPVRNVLNSATSINTAALQQLIVEYI